MGKQKNQPVKKKVPGPGVTKLITALPESTNNAPAPASVDELKRKRSMSLDTQSGFATPPPFHTPPTSPSTPSGNLPSMEDVLLDKANDSELTSLSPEDVESTPHTAVPPTIDLPPISAEDIASGNQDILAIADLFATMKKAIVSMTGVFDRLGPQTKRLVSYSHDLQATEQVKALRSALEKQIERQKQEAEEVRTTLESKVKAAVEEKIRNHLRELVQETLQETIRDRVQEELAKQIPEDLHQKVISHQRQILEVKTTLHNSEARRFNSLQTSTTSNARLRPLLRPLPTPEQSPVAPIPISRSSSVGNAGSTLATPASAFPRVPAPTPIKRSTSNPFREPPTASALFPPDLRSLFSLGPDDTRRLLRDYGLRSGNCTPAVEKAPKEALPIVDEESSVTSDAECGSGDESSSETHAADMNTFMAHIGVPFLMIPAPKEKEVITAPMSSRTRRRRLLTPLIIK